MKMTMRDWLILAAELAILVGVLMVCSGVLDTADAAMVGPVPSPSPQAPPTPPGRL